MALTRTDEIEGGDLFVIWKTGDGDYRGVPTSTTIAWIQNNIVFPTAFTTQYAAPQATGFSVSITDGDDSIYLKLTPAAGYAAGTIVLPSSTNAVDGQEVLVKCSQAVTTLTINGNGGTVSGGPTTIVANGYFKLRYDEPSTTWDRVG